MAPTSLPDLAYLQNPPSGRHLRHVRHQVLRTERFKVRAPDAPQPLAAPNNPSPSAVVLLPSSPVAPATEPSTMPASSDQQLGSNQAVDISGNIVAAAVVVILILGGLIGLVVGGEMLRRRARTQRGKVSSSSERKKSGLIKNAASKPPQHHSKTREKHPYEKMSASLTRPPPVLSRERSRRLSYVWPIRSWSRVLFKRRSCPDQVERLRHQPPVPSPQTTWSEFSPVSVYVAPPRTVLACIPEELEDCESQTNSDIATMLGVTKSLESDLAVSIPQTTELELSLLLQGFNRSESSLTERRPQDCEGMYKAETGDEDTNSLVSSAPDMTSDGGGSSRSSTVSLESLRGGNDRESLQEEVFELRRAQTRSMQMNKGVLLSLSLKTLDDGRNPVEMHEVECGPSQSPSVADAEEDCHVERDLSLAMLGENLSGVSLDEFPSPPSILPMIPSFVSGF